MLAKAGGAGFRVVGLQLSVLKWMKASLARLENHRCGLSGSTGDWARCVGSPGARETGHAVLF